MDCSGGGGGGGGGNAGDGDEAATRKAMSVEPPPNTDDPSAVPSSGAEDVAMDAYEASARAVAEKVRRQQEGLETAMLSPKFADEDFRSVDEIKRLLDAQISANSAAQSSSFLKKRSGSMKKADAQELASIFTHRAKHIPLRLTYEERKTLRLVQAVLRCNSYTSHIDGKTYPSRTKRTLQQMKAIRAVLTGILAAFDYEAGARVADHRAELSEHAKLFQEVFEIARRYKIMNPEKMRSEYGKLLYLLQDCMAAEVREALGFSCVIPIQTVYACLERGGGLEVLGDQYVATATREILPEKKSRRTIRGEIKQKEQAIKYISRNYARHSLSGDTIQRCLYSIGDNSSFLNGARRPVDMVIEWLQQCFTPGSEAGGCAGALAICDSEDGSRLTHSHARQFSYVLQSLTLWREICNDMFRLWYLAEEDLLLPPPAEVARMGEDGVGTQYRLVDTGQGLNRLQPSPRTHKAMHGILYAVQQKLGRGEQGWVGSSVIHLGDTNVPNALMFIDKYNAVARILAPLVNVITQIPTFSENPGLKTFIEQGFGGTAAAQRSILTDFFRAAFDGSGADNFFEAGSCIDGRLTSCWHWCSKLEQKEYFPLFKLARFPSFFLLCAVSPFITV